MFSLMKNEHVLSFSVGRKQFMRFEWANKAASVLGCDCEELSTAVFKHHLKQIIEQVTHGTRGGSQEDDAKSGMVTKYRN